VAFFTPLQSGSPAAAFAMTALLSSRKPNSIPADDSRLSFPIAAAGCRSPRKIPQNFHEAFIIVSHSSAQIGFVTQH
jgi:hypothetical protein